MIKLDQAREQAMNFLNKSGIVGAFLEEISLKDKKWVIIAASIFTSLYSGHYILELDAETGDIVGFKKETGT